MKKPCMLMMVVFMLLATSVCCAADWENDSVIMKISEGQKANRDKIGSGRGLWMTSATDTVAGLKVEAEKLRAGGVEELPDDLKGPFEEPRSRSFHGTIAFDAEKVRCSDHMNTLYAFDGKNACEYRPHPTMPYAYVIDPKKIPSRCSTFDPRDWNIRSAAGGLVDSLRSIPSEFTVRCEEATEEARKLDLITIEYKSGFREQLWFDPERGYEAVKSVLTDEKDELRQEVFTSFIQSSEGGWLPCESTMKYYGVVEPGVRAVLLSSATKNLGQFEFGPVDPREFTLEGLGIPEGTTVMDELKDIDYRYGVPPISDKTLDKLLDTPVVQEVLDVSAGSEPPATPGDASEPVKAPDAPAKKTPPPGCGGP